MTNETAVATGGEAPVGTEKKVVDPVVRIINIALKVVNNGVILSYEVAGEGVSDKELLVFNDTELACLKVSELLKTYSQLFPKQV